MEGHCYKVMLERVSGWWYLLVALDAYTGRSEALPAKAEDAKLSIKFLINQCTQFSLSCSSEVCICRYESVLHACASGQGTVRVQSHLREASSS